MSTLLAGRYQLLEPIGAGGMGQVFRARDTTLDREVAVKLLPEEVAEDPSRRRRFEREARAGARLKHPNIVAIHDFGADGDRPYAVMELLSGADLRTRLAEGALPWRDAVDVALHTARGLDAAHREGVVHRDLKPANLFVADDGGVKILDFGLARLSDPDPAGAANTTTVSELTEAGRVMGTLGYMAPEQVRGRPADPRTDLFALGCVLHEMLSGERPFRGESSAEVMSAILRDEPAPIQRPLPHSLHDILRKCLRKEPGRRFGSAAEIVAALEAVRSSSDIDLIDSATAERAGTAARRRRRVVGWAAALAVIVLAAVFAVGVWRQSRPTAPAEPSLDAHRIAVAPFAGAGSDPDLEALGRRAADRIVQELADIEGLEVAPSSLVASVVEGRVSSGTGANELVRGVAEATSAGLVVTGLIRPAGAEIELRAALEDAAAGVTIRAFDTLPTTRDGLDSTLTTLSGWVYVTTMETLHPALAFAAGDRIPDVAAFREYVVGMPNLGLRPEAAEHIARALEMDPGFDRIRIFRSFGTWGLPEPPWEVSDLLLRPLESRRSELSASQQRLVDACRWGLDGRWSGALGLFQAAAAKRPDDPMSQAVVIHTAMFANHPRAALEAFADFHWDPIQPWTALKVIVFDAAKAHHRLGDHEAELLTVRNLRDTHPFFSMVWLREREAVALAAAGRVEECERLVEQSLSEPAHWPTRHGEVMLSVAGELRAHGHQDASRAMAQRALGWLGETEFPAEFDSRAQEYTMATLSFLGRHEEAHRLAVEQLADDPDSWPHRAEVGIEAAWIGDREAAMAVSRHLAGVDEPFTMGGPSHARAAIATQLGSHDEAIRLLRQAVAEGFWDWDRLHIDIDFDALRGDPRFQEIIRPRG